MSQRKRIAIIGSGISGLTCGYLLSKSHDVTLFEANDYIGGHTATKPITVNDSTFNIDTGFIVFNDWTYPNFIKMMDTLNVDRQPTQMSFSVQNASTGLEYNGHTINTLFAQRRNLVSPSFYGLVGEILKFNKLCKSKLEQAQENESVTLIDFLHQHQFSTAFTQNYILPMCAAIWSASLDTAGQFPLAFFLKFFSNHGLLNITDRPQWFTIKNGSFSYIDPMIEGFKDNIHLSTPVIEVSRQDHQLTLKTHEHSYNFDDVIFACHSDQVLNILELSTFTTSLAQSTKEVLGAIPYAMNDVVLHSDIKVLPKRKLAWASWNYRLKGSQNEQDSPAAVSYNMNILQRLDSEHTFIVTLNDSDSIDPSKILGEYKYAHPQFSLEMVAAQKKRSQICGKDNVHYCGAYWYNGFHEDGVRSALDVCERFGVTL
ncbi:MAG: FAD-dependent oxidoreductase [Pseudomonadota bacterium]